MMKENKKEVYDEISQYLNTRYLEPSECSWRISKFPLSGRSHAVERSAVHTFEQQSIIFEDYQKEEALNKNKDTTLTAWFKLNMEDPFARNIKYVNIPLYYLWNASLKKWIRRKNEQKVVSRLYNVSPRDIERFHLKLILGYRKGATSFEDLKFYNNKQYLTYLETANAMRLIENDENVYTIFDEAKDIMMPKQLRSFFAYYLITDTVIVSYNLWEKYKVFLSEDFTVDKENKALLEIEKILKSENLLCKDVGLPTPIENDFTEYLNVDEYKKISDELINKLNSDQKIVFNAITGAHEKHKENLFFVDGAGGTGKTFLYKALIYYFWSERKKVLSMAWTGIASTL